MYRYLIVIEKADRNYSAFSPDLPGCIATGKTRQEVTRNMQGAIELHIQGMVEDHLPIPAPRSSAEYVTIPVG
jgi:predicted RNase H-like HicB family nuclease